MKKTGKLTLLLVTVLSLTLMMGLSASAAAKRKLVKTLKEYDIDGNLSCTTSYKYNAKGDTTSEIYKEYSKGKVCLTQKTTMKRSYYKGTGRVKKVTYKRSLSGRKSNLSIYSIIFHPKLQRKFLLIPIFVEKIVVFCVADEVLFVLQ